MFIQNMVYTGFYAVWILYNILYVVYVTDIISHSRLGKGRKNIGSYIVRIYLISITNLFMAVSIVVIPIIALIIGVHVYWIVMGVIYTLVLHVFYVRLYVMGEVVGIKYKSKEINRVNENRNLKILMYLLYVVIGVYYLLIVFNAFEILPIIKVILPPIMPLYFHFLVDMLNMIFLALLNVIVLYVMKLRIRGMVVKGD